MRGMGKKAKPLVIAALAIAGAMAAHLRADVMALVPTMVQSIAASDVSRAEIRGCVVRVAGKRRGISSNGTDRITSTVSQGADPRLPLFCGRSDSPVGTGTNVAFDSVKGGMMGPGTKMEPTTLDFCCTLEA